MEFNNAKEIKNLMNQFGLIWIDYLCVQINGLEYKNLARVNNKTVSYIRNDDLMKYGILDEKETEDFYNILSNNTFVDDFYCFASEDFLGGLSYEVYQKQVESIHDKYGLDKDSRLIDWIRPVHIIRRSEVESFYQYTNSVVLKGVEYKEWGDGAVRDPWKEPSGCLMPDYISINQPQHIEGIPEDEIIHREAGDGREYRLSFDYIPKKYLEEVILYRHYLDPSDIENSLRKKYIGKYDQWNLDINNPTPEIFDFMREHEACKVLK